jgi:DNA-binding response OmpR family regulator
MEARSLLVVEDDADTSILVCRALRRSAPQWEVRMASNGCAAKSELLRDPRPTILVTDLDMPVMDGFGLIEWTRTVEALARLRIIVFSGSMETSAEDRCRRLAVDGYVQKLATFDNLQERITALIAASAMAGGHLPG